MLLIASRVLQVGLSTAGRKTIIAIRGLRLGPVSHNTEEDPERIGHLVGRPTARCCRVYPIRSPCTCNQHRHASKSGAWCAPDAGCAFEASLPSEHG